MNKIPVLRSIAFGYAYLLHQIGAIVSLCWFPALLFAAADAAMRLFSGDAAASGTDEIAGPSIPAMMAAIPMIAAQAMAAASVTRHALGRPGSGLAATAALDHTGLRMIAANFRFYLGLGVLAVLAMSISFVAFLLAGVSIEMPEAAQATIASTIAAVLSLMLFVYVGVTAIRMGFFLPASVVAEDKSGLKRSHDLAMGNFWRIVAVLAALMLPMEILRIAGQLAALGPDALNQDDPGLLMQQAAAAIRQQIVPWEIFNAVLFVLGSGLLYPGLAYAYRAIVPETKAPKLD